MRVLVFGLDNEDAVLSGLRKAFPTIGFRKCRANEDIEDEGKRLIVIDTVTSVKSVLLLDCLESGYLAGEASKAISVLRILKSLGSIDSVRVIAVPESYPSLSSIREISGILRSLV
jgi:hypothetical protein